ncbi:MAG: hypothetical protein ACWGSQ_13915, partial [Longimicrobiales bacterium]
MKRDGREEVVAVAEPPPPQPARSNALGVSASWPEESRTARALLWGLVAVHLGLILLSLNDYFVSIDSGYHVSLGRYYAEHLTAFWDHINYGPYGRPNLQGPLFHVAIGALGWIFGGSGDAYVLANTLLAVLQWVAAVFTVVFFSRRLGGDWAA